MSTKVVDDGDYVVISTRAAPYGGAVREFYRTRVRAADKAARKAEQVRQAEAIRELLIVKMPEEEPVV